MSEQMDERTAKLEALLYDAIQELSYIETLGTISSQTDALVNKGMGLLGLSGLWENSLKNTREYELDHPEEVAAARQKVEQKESQPETRTTLLETR